MSRPRRERRSVVAVEAVGPYALVRVTRGSLDPGIPGQFFMLEAPGRVLPRPMSLCLVPRGELAFLLDPIGPGTKALAALESGDALTALLFGNAPTLAIAVSDLLDMDVDVPGSIELASMDQSIPDAVSPLSVVYSALRYLASRCACCCALTSRCQFRSRSTCRSTGGCSPSP